MRLAIEPEQAALCKDGIRMRDRPWFLTGQHMAELCEKGFAIDLDGRRLGRDEQGVLPRAGQCFFPLRIASTRSERKVVVNDKPVVLGAIWVQDPFDVAYLAFPVRQVARQVSCGILAGGLAEEFDSKRHLAELEKSESAEVFPNAAELVEISGSFEGGSLMPHVRIESLWVRIQGLDLGLVVFGARAHILTHDVGKAWPLNDQGGRECGYI